MRSKEHPEIDTLDNPGLWDTRGVNFDIAADVALQRLRPKISSVRVLFLFLNNEIMRSGEGLRSSSIRHPLYALGAIVNKNKKAMENVRIILNKSKQSKVGPLGRAGQFHELERQWSDDKNSDITEETKYLLRNLEDKHFVSMDFPSPDVSDMLWNEVILKLSSSPTSRFSFQWVSREAVKLQQLIKVTSEVHKQHESDAMLFRAAASRWALRTLTSESLYRPADNLLRSDDLPELNAKSMEVKRLWEINEKLLLKLSSVFQAQDSVVEVDGLQAGRVDSLTFQSPRDVVLLGTIRSKSAQVEVSGNVVELLRSGTSAA
jgi:hypothetical protein